MSDQKALTATLKEIRANDTFSSSLTRWVDRLLSFQFTVKHEPGRTFGLADYLHPSPVVSEIPIRAKQQKNSSPSKSLKLDIFPKQIIKN